MPRAAAKASAPSPASITCGEASITARARRIGLRTRRTPAIAPARPLAPSMIAASSALWPSWVNTAPRPALNSGASSSTAIAAATASSAAPPSRSTACPACSARARAWRAAASSAAARLPRSTPAPPCSTSSGAAAGAPSCTGSDCTPAWAPAASIAPSASQAAIQVPPRLPIAILLFRCGARRRQQLGAFLGRVLEHAHVVLRQQAVPQRGHAEQARIDQQQHQADGHHRRRARAQEARGGVQGGLALAQGVAEAGGGQGRDQDRPQAAEQQVPDRVQLADQHAAEEAGRQHGEAALVRAGAGQAHERQHGGDQEAELGQLDQRPFAHVVAQQLDVGVQQRHRGGHDQRQQRGTAQVGQQDVPLFFHVQTLGGGARGPVGGGPGGGERARWVAEF